MATLFTLWPFTQSKLLFFTPFSRKKKPFIYIYAPSHVLGHLEMENVDNFPSFWQILPILSGLVTTFIFPWNWSNWTEAKSNGHFYLFAFLFCTEALTVINSKLVFIDAITGML